MKLDHFVQNLAIKSLELDIGIPTTARLLHGEGDVVAEANVFAVVETAAGAGGAGALLLGWECGRRRGY